MPDTDLLRKLRLWHWSQVLDYRAHEQRLQSGGRYPTQGKTLKAERDAFDRLAGKHIRAVQILNDFFPPGDTAERDAASGMRAEL